MEKIVVWTNDFYGKDEEVMKHLRSGKAVRVGADCIGHTRAKMVKYQAERFFEEIGAKEIIETDEWGCKTKWWIL